jgi:hypothetical protein
MQCRQQLASAPLGLRVDILQYVRSTVNYWNTVNKQFSQMQCRQQLASAPLDLRVDDQNTVNEQFSRLK